MNGPYGSVAAVTGGPKHKFAVEPDPQPIKGGFSSMIPGLGAITGGIGGALGGGIPLPGFSDSGDAVSGGPVQVGGLTMGVSGGSRGSNSNAVAYVAIGAAALVAVLVLTR